MLKVTSDGSTITVETGVSKLTWDAQCGGQIVALAAKDDLFEHALAGDGPIPGLQFIVDGKAVKLSDARAKLELVSEDSERIVIRSTASLANGALEVEMIYEAFPEGVVFCELGIDTPDGKQFTLADASLNIPIKTSDVNGLRWGVFRRDGYVKRDATGIHGLINTNQFQSRKDNADARQLFPVVTLDLGWKGTRFYSNRVEFVMEDWTAFDYEDFERTRTQVAERDGCWRLKWSFFDGGTARITGPWRYRNKWGMAVGRARTQAGADADPTTRNNVLGARVCHVMYPYARMGDKWPWAVMPIRQITAQPPMLFKGLPEIERADEAADFGANVMILHQMWMANPGSNNEPPADYKALDPEWMKAWVARCHDRGMRVLVYNRGTEPYQMYASFFEDYLQKDFDGLYTDWGCPYTLGYIKTSTFHASIYAYFMYSREMRRRIGEGGAWIQHSPPASYIPAATGDVLLGGEVSVRHDELLASPEGSSYYSLLDCCGGHLISGNWADRAAFSSRRATAVCSAFGMTGHPFMEPHAPLSTPAAYIKPLWDAMLSLPGKVVRLHNPAYAPTKAVGMGTEALFPSLWQSDAGKAMLLITNLSEAPTSGAVELNVGELDVAKGARVQPLKMDGVAPCEVDGGVVKVKDLQPLWFCGVSIG